MTRACLMPIAAVLMAATTGCGSGSKGPAAVAPEIVATVEGVGRGRVVGAGDSTPVALRFTDRSGGPVAGRGIVLVAPAEGPTGQFPSSSPLGPNALRLVTDADGRVQTTLTTGSAPGPFLLAALVEDSDSAETVAVTVVAAPVSPTLSATQARAAVESKLLNGRPLGGSLRLHGPVLLPPGTTVSRPGGGSPQTLAKSTWLCWLDEAANKAFSHGARYVMMDADDAAPGYENRLVEVSAQWWPEITLPGSQPLELLPANMLDGSLVPSSRAASPSGAIRFFENGPGATRAEEVACAIVVHGPHAVSDAAGNAVPGSNFDNDAQTFRQALIDSGKVASNAILPLDNTSVPTTREYLTGAVKSAQDSGCTKLHFFLMSHGGIDGVALRGPQGGPPVDVVSWNDLAAILSQFKGKLCVFVGGCYGAYLVDALQNRGITGQIATASSKTGQTTTYDEADRPYTPYALAFTNCLLDPAADQSNPKDGVDYVEAALWAQAHAGDGMPNSAEFKADALDGSPTQAVISPGAASPYSLPGVNAIRAGDNVTVTINVQRPANPAQTFSAVLTIKDASIARFQDGTTTVRLELKSGTSQTVTIHGVADGETTWSLDGQAGPNHMVGGPSPIRVGSRFVGDPNGQVIFTGQSLPVVVVRQGAIAFVSQQVDANVTALNPTTAFVGPAFVQYPAGTDRRTVTVVGNVVPGIATFSVMDSVWGVTGTFTVEVRQRVTLDRRLTVGEFVWEAGESISTDRITGYRIIGPDTGCDGWHLHSTAGSITIDGHGPIPDPLPGGCGYGRVIQPSGG